jgi:hypothetical protein
VGKKKIVVERVFDAEFSKLGPLLLVELCEQDSKGGLRHQIRDETHAQ